MDDLISRQAAIDALKNDERYNEDIPNRADGVRDAIITVLSMPAVNRWIPCSERLPKYGETVLITNDKGNVSYGRFRGVEFWKEDGDSCWTWKKNTIEHVLAWMPLPEPYKEEEGEL